MIGNIVLGTSETTIYSPASGKTFAMLSMCFCNTTTTDKVVTVYCYSTGGSASDSTTLIKSITIPAQDTFVWNANEKFILSALDKISGKADVGSSITVTWNGMEI